MHKINTHNTPTCTCIHTHIHTHKHMHIYTHTQTHMHIHTYMHTYVENPSATVVTWSPLPSETLDYLGTTKCYKSVQANPSGGQY